MLSPCSYFWIIGAVTPAAQHSLSMDNPVAARARFIRPPITTPSVYFLDYNPEHINHLDRMRMRVGHQYQLCKRRPCFGGAPASSVVGLLDPVTQGELQGFRWPIGEGKSCLLALVPPPFVSSLNTSVMSSARSPSTNRSVMGSITLRAFVTGPFRCRVRLPTTAPPYWFPSLGGCPRID